MSWEQIDWFKNLSFKKREELMGKSIKNIEHPKMKLIQSGILIPELTEEFDPQQHFTENKKVKYWLGDNFKKYVLNPAKKVSMSVMTKEDILRIIAYLTSKQPNGEVGELQTNGCAIIIGYLLCDDGVVRAVGVRWNPVSLWWGCHCDDLNY